MAGQTYKAIVQDCVSEALGLPRDPIGEDIRDLALASLNDKGEIIWQSWPFDNERMDEFTAPDPDADGIITFAADVDVVRAVKAASSADGTTDTIVWPQDRVMAAMRGESVGSDRFIRLADDSSGCRRIRIDADNAASSYKILALKRFTRGTVESSYSEANPTATPTDYRVLTFVLDRALPALRAFVKDALRRYEGIPAERDGDRLLSVAVQREQFDEHRERRVIPRRPLFEDAGRWNE